MGSEHQHKSLAEDNELMKQQSEGSSGERFLCFFKACLWTEGLFGEPCAQMVLLGQVEEQFPSQASALRVPFGA